MKKWIACILPPDFFADVEVADVWIDFGLGQPREPAGLVRVPIARDEPGSLAPNKAAVEPLGSAGGVGSEQRFAEVQERIRQGPCRTDGRIV